MSDQKEKRKKEELTLASEIGVINDRYLCKQFGLSPTTAWRMRRRKNNPLPFFYVGGQIRYSLAEVQKFFAESRERG